ncbi:MAG TPA: Na+/H+ antiporter [Humisphaera sp.]
MHLHPAELIFLLLAAVAALAWLASRVRVPYPIFLTLAGGAISFIPGLPRVPLDPNVVFLIFLPPLLYYSGMMTSWRDFSQNLRPISLLAVGLVLFTTAAVALVAHAVYPQMGWAAAFVLGAIVSPPDAVAAAAITQRLRVPKRIVTVLEGESLVNDASALIAYKFAIAAVATGAFSVADASLQFVWKAAGGIAVGYAAGWVMAWLRPRLRDSSVEGIAALLIPYVAYLPAEKIHVSGVLAAVTAGVYIGRRVPQITTSTNRLRLYAVWDTLIFLLNGLVFILLGLALPEVIANLSALRIGWWHLVGWAAAVSAVTIVARLVWVFPAAYLPRLLPYIRRRDPVPPVRSVFLIGWTGLRGIVSLAAALALPTTLADGSAFPGRDLILFLTFGVILVTLVGQGLTLPLVIRWLRLEGDGIEEREEELARLEMTNAALARLQVLELTNADAEAAEFFARVRQPYEQRLRYYGGRRRGIVLEDGEVCETTVQLTRVALGAEREMLVRLRDDGAIGDDVLRKLQTELDLQEARIGDDEAPAERATAAG